MDRDHEIQMTIRHMHSTHIKVEATVDNLVVVDMLVPDSKTHDAIELTLDAIRIFVMGKLGYMSTGGDY